MFVTQTNQAVSGSDSKLMLQNTPSFQAATDPLATIKIPAMISILDSHSPRLPAPDSIGVIEKMGSSGIHTFFDYTSNKGEGLVNKMLNSLHIAIGSCFGKPYNLAIEDIQNSFRNAIKDMTSGELDEVREAIVSKIVSPHVSHSDTPFLRKLYSDVAPKMLLNKPEKK